MKKKGITFMVAGILAVGTLTGFAYANSADATEKGLSKLAMERKLWAGSSQSVEVKEAKEEKEVYKDMIKLMKKNGFGDMAKAIEKNDYAAIDEFMNNITDEDYEKMIEIMKENGYEDMARMMESMDKDQMIQMHNAMGGAENCHSDSSGMMNNN